MPPRILVCWYGSFEANGTIGDLLSVRVLTSFLADLGYELDCASYRPFSGINGKILDWRAADPLMYDAVLFACGPILKRHENLRLLFERFRACRRIGVAVSLFPEPHFNAYNPFDLALAREGGTSNAGDLAILGINSWAGREASLDETVVGICLAGRQDEYGAGQCLWQRTEQVMRDAAELVLRERRGRVEFIENHLDRSRKSPDEILRQYAGCDVVLTSRFHGAVLALAHGVPCVALDQIQGGAKVSRLLGRTGWPHVYHVTDTGPLRIAENAIALVQRAPTFLRRVVQIMRSDARSTLDQLAGKLSDQLAPP